MYTTVYMYTIIIYKVHDKYISLLALLALVPILANTLFFPVHSIM